MPRPKKEPEVLYTNYIARKAKRMMGRDFRAGDRIPVGLLPSNKLKQLEEHNLIVDVGHSLTGRLRKDGYMD